MPPVEMLRPNLWSIPVPLPDNPLRYVLVYVLESKSEVTLIDAGWNTEVAWTALEGGLTQAGFGISDVTGVLVTHIHPDHYGLAGRVREVSGAWVALHPADASLIPGRYGAGMTEVIQAMRSLLSLHGVPEGIVRELSDASLGMREFVDAVEPDILLDDGKKIDLPGWDLVTVHTPGHSPGHVCFLEREEHLLFSGDHVLPRISPSISVHAQQMVNPLADFLESLLRVRAMEVAEVLPAHEWRFAPLSERVDELLAHHDRRLNETKSVLKANPGFTCWEITRQLSWSRHWEEIRGFMRRAAVGETLAHLVLLESRGEVRRATPDPVTWELAGTPEQGS